MATTEQVLKLNHGDITYMDMIDKDTSLGESQIQRVFVGATVLVTGGTGFLGKLLIEKLLRSCKDIKKIYVLARAKKNKDPVTRLQEQFNDVLYDKLRQQQPEFVEKITLVEGDVGKLSLGLSDDDMKTLRNEVNIIFHGAATVRFNEPLKTAVEINVRGTKEMLLLAKLCTKLQALVHISTAYSNCINKEVAEEFYELRLSGDKLIQLIENFDEDFIDKITPELLQDYPNTYTFSKLAGEDIVKQYSKQLPVAVCRPSMVISTAEEPLAGWTDNSYGAIGATLGGSLGILHTFHCNSSAVADIIPGDKVVNCCVATAWKLVMDWRSSHDATTPPVYNIVSSAQNPIIWNRFMKNTKKVIRKIPTSNAMWYPFIFLIPSQVLNCVVTYLLHWIPAYIVDGLAVLVGKKPMLKMVYKKIEKFSEVLTYFSTREWKFKDDNTVRLFRDMCEADKQIFNFDITNLDWEKYINDFIYGLRVYLLKDPMETVPQARRKMMMFLICQYLLFGVIALCILSLTSAILQFVF